MCFKILKVEKSAKFVCDATIQLHLQFALPV